MHMIQSHDSWWIKGRLRGESYRQWIERNLEHSDAGIVFDSIQCFFSLMMIIHIIHLNWNQANDMIHNKVLDTLNLVIISLNLVIRFLAATNRSIYCCQWLFLIDLSCCLSLLIQQLSPFNIIQEYHLFFRFLVLIRVSRLLQFYRLLRLATSGKTRQGLLIMLTAICIIICAAAVFQTIEDCDIYHEKGGKQCQNLSFFDSIYFVCITVGTVGYGELAPKSQLGKVTVIFLILFTGVLIPTQISAYTDILNRETPFDKKYRVNKRTQHILLCGDIDNGALSSFLYNCLRTDRTSRRKVIILSPHLPPPSLHRILIHQDYEQRVLYIQGSAMDITDLARAGAASAVYCCVMTKKHVTNESDTATNLITCSIRKTNELAPLMVQVSKIHSIRHITISGATSSACIEQLQLRIFGKSMWIKGLNTFLGNLVERFVINQENDGFWLSDYARGCCYHIYEAILPSFLFNMTTFQALAILLYREFEVPLIGIRTITLNTIHLYPIAQELKASDCKSVFFLAPSREIKIKIEKLTKAVFQKHQDIAPPMYLSDVSHHGHSALRALSAAFSNASARRKEENTILSGWNHSLGATSERSSEGTGTTSTSSPVINTVKRLSTGKITPDLDNKESDARGRMSSEQSTSELKHRLSTGKITPEPEQMNEKLSSMMAALDAVPNPLTGSDPIPLNSRCDSLVLDEDRSTSTRITSLESNGSIGPVIALSPAELVKKATSPLSIKERHSLARKGARSRSLRRASMEESMRSESRFSLRIETPSPPDDTHSIPNDTKSTDPPEKSLSLQIDTSCSQSETGYRQSPRGRRGTKFTEQWRSFQRRGPPSDISNHYVVCGVPTSYSELIQSLYSDSEESMPAIVFVTSQDLSEEEYNISSKYPQVYYVRGSSVSLHVFDQARMLYARGILILAYCGGHVEDLSHSDESMADVDAITTYRFISEACQNNTTTSSMRRGILASQPQGPYIIVEMSRPSNVKFLSETNTKDKNTRTNTYNERTPRNETRAHQLLQDAEVFDESYFSSLYAGGHIYFTNFVDALLGASSYHFYLLEMLSLLVGCGNNYEDGSESSRKSQYQLAQIAAPMRYHNRPYGIMVEGLLVNESMMALGLYRAARGFASPSFVFTNPPSHEIVQPHDHVFVIQDRVAHRE